MTVSIEINKWIEIMAFLFRNEGSNMSRMAVKLDITYTHVSHIIKELCNKKMVIKKMSGRQSILTLTNKGRIVAECCYVINKKLFWGKNARI